MAPLEADPGGGSRDIGQGRRGKPSIGRHGKQRSITVDSGKEFTERALVDLAYRRGVLPEFPCSGNPAEDWFIQSFNGKRRDECPNANQFLSIEDAKRKIQAWRVDYNVHRPHSGLGNMSPAESVKGVRNED